MSASPVLCKIPASPPSAPEAHGLSMSAAINAASIFRAYFRIVADECPYPSKQTLY